MPIRRGEIYWVEFDPVKGSEQGGLRPALVIQNDVGNQASPTTVVAAITRTLPPRAYPFVVTIAAEESGLSEASAINCAQLATIQKDGDSSRLRPFRGETAIRPIGRLGPARMADVEAAIRFNLGLR